MSRREDDFEWELPHNRDAEQVVLGAMMLSATAVTDVTAVLADSGDFYRPAHQIVYEAVLVLAGRPGENGDPPAHDVIAVADYLAGARQLSKVGGGDYLHTLIAAVPTTANAGYYAGIVREYSIERQMILAGGRIVQAAREHGSSDLADKVDYAYRVLDQASGVVAPAQARPVAEMLPAALDAMETGDTGGRVLTGWTDLDDLTGGLAPGQLVVIASRPSVGKSVAVFNIVDHVATDLGLPVVLASLEMSRQECLERLLAARARVSLTAIRDRTLSDEDWETRLTPAVSDLASAPLHITDDPYIRIQGLRSDLRALRRAGTPAALIGVDYLQLITTGRRTENRQAEVAEISRALKLLGKEFGCVVLVAAQLNRGPEMRADHRPVLADLRDSGTVEQDADLVILLYRDEMYDLGGGSARAGEIDLIIAKHRAGPTATVTMAFRGWQARIVDMAWTASRTVPGESAWVDPSIAREDELAARRNREPR